MPITRLRSFARLARLAFDRDNNYDRSHISTLTHSRCIAALAAKHYGLYSPWVIAGLLHDIYRPDFPESHAEMAATALAPMALPHETWWAIFEHSRTQHDLRHDTNTSRDNSPEGKQFAAWEEQSFVAGCPRLSMINTCKVLYKWI